MSCTQKKWKEQNINNRTFKNKRYRKPTQQPNSFGKSTQLIKICTTLRWQLSIRDKVLCREFATKRVEDDGDKQSSCSQVLVREMKSVASASCCIYFSNLRQNSSTLDLEISIYVCPCLQCEVIHSGSGAGMCYLCAESQPDNFHLVVILLLYSRSRMFVQLLKHFLKLPIGSLNGPKTIWLVRVGWKKNGPIKEKKGAKEPFGVSGNVWAIA
jgi:hypothetical protein